MKRLLLAVVLAWEASVAAADTPPTDAPRLAVSIDPDAPSRPYGRMIFGGFIEHFGRQIYGGIFEPGSPLADERGFRRDVIAALKELKLAVVRWPGGCFASGYHWRDGVGKVRKPVADPVWGVVDDNTFGTDEFVLWCRRVGCEPYICTNAGNGTPEEMRQWVEYCNATTGPMAELRKANGHEKPFGVKYWSIGNENYGSWEIGRKRPDAWGAMVHRCAALMRGVDPTIKLAAAAWLARRDWDLPLLKAAGSDLDYMAVHQYWLGYWRRNAMPPYRNCIGLFPGPEKTLTDVIAVLAEAGVRGRVKIAFDEWNLRGWHHPGFPRKQPVDPNDAAAAELIARRRINADPRQYTMTDALFAASFLNASLRHCEDVGMTNIAPIVNTRGPLYVHPRGIVKRTTFHALAMYANLLEPRVAAVEVAADPLAVGRGTLPVAEALVTTDAAHKRWAVALVNRDPARSVRCTLRVGGDPLEGDVRATVLAGDDPDAYNDIEHPDRVRPEQKTLRARRGAFDLPPHSLTVVRFAAP